MQPLGKPRGSLGVSLGPVLHARLGLGYIAGLVLMHARVGHCLGSCRGGAARLGVSSIRGRLPGVAGLQSPSRRTLRPPTSNSGGLKRLNYFLLSIASVLIQGCPIFCDREDEGTQKSGGVPRCG